MHGNPADYRLNSPTRILILVVMLRAVNTSAGESTTDNTESTDSSNTAVIVSVSVGVVIFVLLHVVLIVLVAWMCVRRKSSANLSSSNYVQVNVNVQEVEEVEPNSNLNTSYHMLQVPSLMRQRQGSAPNNYFMLGPPTDDAPGPDSVGIPKKSATFSHGQNKPTNNSSSKKGRPSSNSEGGYGYDSASLLNEGNIHIYDYIRSEGNGDPEYDYESPYWLPSNEVRGLLQQFRKLRVQSISHKDLEEKEVLGSGAFGTVNRGVWLHRGEELMEEEVAVKTMEKGSSKEDRVKFLQEAAIMAQFNHPNIVKIIGIMVKEDKCKIVMELMPKGNLRAYLPTLKLSFTNQTVLASQLLYYSRQIASGMSYLCVKGYIHRDLAARNILVSKDDMCKIGDFGLSRDLQKEDYYHGHGGLIPVKWTAPEALHYRLYSTASDVWSYGCVLYEIWSLGVKPYSDFTNAEVIAKVPSGYRLPPPPGCPRKIYDIMIKCWNADSDSRPGFYQICSLLNLPDIRILQWSEEDLARYGEGAKTIGAPLAEGESLFTELQNMYVNVS